MSTNNDNITEKDIIQTDAAVIAGILILLTISSFSPFEFPNRSMFVSLIVPAIVLFSISAISAINKELNRGKKIWENRILLDHRIYDFPTNSKCYQYNITRNMGISSAEKIASSNVSSTR
jgi:hypothetical protein